MNEQNIDITTKVSFQYFLYKNKRNKIILLLVALAILIQITIFKYLYPYASYIHGDSFSYLRAADQNLTINTYLIGYSLFLRLFSVFSTSDFALVTFQYLFIQCSALLLLFTLSYFCKVSKVTEVILLSFFVFNPLFLHLANLISSDGYFLSLSLIWFSLLVWIIYNPSKQLIFWHAIVLFLAFLTRYNAMLYPVISVGVMVISKMPIRQKVAGIGIVIILCGSFVIYTGNNYKALTGKWQYSPFSGWQWANNAMYAYRYVDSVKRKPVKQKFENLDKMVRNYFDRTRDINKYPTESIMASTFYMWSKGMPLMQYKDSMFKKDTKSKELKKWASMGPLYKEYGIYIIEQYPWQFVRYFLWPNANKYYAPPVEFLGSYNSGKDSVPLIAQNWFRYKSAKLTTRTKNKQNWILDFYPILSGVINVVMLCTLLCFLFLKGWQYDKIFNKSVYLGATIWFLNAGFTIFASSAALRFQSFPIMLTTIIVVLLIDWMIQLMIIMKRKPFDLSDETQILKQGISIQTT